MLLSDKLVLLISHYGLDALNQSSVEFDMDRIMDKPTRVLFDKTITYFPSSMQSSSSGNSIKGHQCL